MLDEVHMPQDVLELVERYVSDDPSQWGRLASDIQWRRLQLLLLREIVLEMKDLQRRIELMSGDVDPTRGADEK
jgi:hypothetical protein